MIEDNNRRFITLDQLKFIGARLNREGTFGKLGRGPVQPTLREYAARLNSEASPREIADLQAMRDYIKADIDSTNHLLMLDEIRHECRAYQPKPKMLAWAITLICKHGLL